MTIMTTEDLLATYPSLRGDAEYTDSNALADLKEWAEIAKGTIEQAAAALEAADVPRVEDVVGQKDTYEVRLDLAGRILLLTKQRDAKELEREHEAKKADRCASEALTRRIQLDLVDAVFRNAGVPVDELTTDQGAEWLRRELEAQRARTDKAEADLSELVITVRQALGAESVAEALAEARQLRKMYDGASTDLDNARRECEVLRLELDKVRDSLTNDVAFFKRKAEARGAELQLATSKIEDLSARYNRAADEVQAHAEQRGKEMAERCPHKASSCMRMHTRLTAKIKRREDDIERYRAELAKKPARTKPRTKKSTRKAGRS